MSVAQYNPTEKIPVSFTTKAIEHLANQVVQKSAKGIVFNVREAGCSGFKYLLELAFEVDNDAIEYSLADNLKLFVSPKVLPLIHGTEVDYVKEGVNYNLTFANPNATASCGCGESFSVEPH